MGKLKCECGGVIFENTKDWTIPVCYDCFVALEEKAQKLADEAKDDEDG